MGTRLEESLNRELFRGRDEEWEQICAVIDRSEREHPELCCTITRILFETDPVGFIRMCPEIFTDRNEFEKEAGTILPRLQDAGSEQDVLDIVLEEFDYFCGVSESDRSDPFYIEAARQIWEAWLEYRARPR